MKIIEIITERESRYGEDEGRTLKNPMPHITSDDKIFGHIFDLYDDVVGEIASKLNINDMPTKWKKATAIASKVQNVPMGAVVTTEKFLDPRGARSQDIPSMLKYEGKYYVLDGNHRVYKSYSEGDKTVKASVIEVGNT